MTLTIILVVIAVLVVAFVLFVASRRADFYIARSAVIPAPLVAVFAEIDDFHCWQAWSPWAKLDPAAKNTFEGAPSGQGAEFQWSGNQKVGEGRMTILESDPGKRISIRLVFIRPFAATNHVEFTFQPDGTGTLVTWSMRGKSNFMMKAVGLFLNCDKLIGLQYEQGLENLKAVVAGQG